MRKGIYLIIFLSLFAANSVSANDCTDNALSQRMSCDSQTRNSNDKIACKNAQIVQIKICSNKQFNENLSDFNSSIDNLKSTIDKQYGNNGDN